MRTAKHIALFLAMIVLTTACSSTRIKPVKTASDYPGSETALIAFSVISQEPFVIQKLLLFEPGAPSPHQASRVVRVRPEQGDQQVFLYRVPAEGVKLGSVRLLINGQWWETGLTGPEISAAAGQLTYAGRVQLHSVKMSRYEDTGRIFPAKVRLLMTDASEEDLAQLADQSALPQDMSVTKAIPGSWSDSEFVALSYRQIPGREGRYQSWEFSSGPVGPPPPAVRTNQP
jgi:hypothetical protein